MGTGFYILAENVFSIARGLCLLLQDQRADECGAIPREPDRGVPDLVDEQRGDADEGGDGGILAEFFLTTDDANGQG